MNSYNPAYVEFTGTLNTKFDFAILEMNTTFLFILIPFFDSRKILNGIVNIYTCLLNAGTQQKPALNLPGLLLVYST